MSLPQARRTRGLRNSRRTLDDLLKLLESYRAALRISKPREVAEVDPKELITKYYRLQTDIAIDLEKLLPELIQPETWKSVARPEATGTIRNVSSKSGLLGVGGVDVRSTVPQGKTEAVVVANSVLIIRQSREIHDAIDKVFNKIQFGDAGDVLKPVSGNVGANPAGMGGGMGGMGGGMGGMGGGGIRRRLLFQSLENERRREIPVPILRLKPQLRYCG